MEVLFRRFAEKFGSENTYRRFRLLAIDGSDLHVPTNPDDPASYFVPKNGCKAYNLLHLNAMYDLLNNIYTDAIIKGSQVCSEQQVLTQLVDRSSVSSAFLLADRGYEGFNSLAHVQEKGIPHEREQGGCNPYLVSKWYFHAALYRRS